MNKKHDLTFFFIKKEKEKETHVMKRSGYLFFNRLIPNLIIKSN